MSAAEPNTAPELQGNLLGGPPEPVADPSPDWHSSLSEDLRGNKSIQETKSVEALAQRYVDAQKVIGKKGVIAPKDGDLADFDRFVRESGFKPESREVYQPALSVPEGLAVDDASMKVAVDRAYEAGVHPGQLESVMNAVLESQHAAQESAITGLKERTAEAREKIKHEWGEDFDSRLQRAKQTYGLVREAAKDEDDLSQLVLPDGTKVGDHPAFARHYDVIGERMSEQALLGEREPAAPMTIEDAQAALANFVTEHGAEMAPDSASPRAIELRRELSRLALAADPDAGRTIGEVKDEVV